MAEVSIRQKEREDTKTVFEVRIAEDRNETVHEVWLEDKDWSRLTGGTMSRADLVRKSFDFLLNKESKESILGKFGLMEIQDYFPDYEDQMRVKL